MTEPDRSDHPERRRRKMQSVTMSDVARAAQVSPSTVSLYLRKPEAVSERVGARVADAIETLGYVPNFVAGGLAAATSRVVSVTVPSLRNAFFSETVTELERLLSGRSLHTLVGHTEYSLEQEERLVRAALSWSPAAVVLTGHTHTDTTRDLLARSGASVVEMWDFGPDPIGRSVGFSHHAVGRCIADHFASQGYGSGAFAGARLTEDARAAQRAQGFLDGMRDRGLSARLVEVAGPASTGAGADLLSRVMEDPVRAVACSNDTVALGVMFEAARRGLRVPQDLAVAGFGDLEFAAQTIPPLTTVRPPAKRIAAAVAEAVLLGPDGDAPRRVDVKFAFCRRGSA
ncbi:LacI family transcriptional regulator [Palleronia aestuarii]|uniref:LacI family transcriptional regulator n=1 Tax=Palleronia aestuarii TaxID=568105 RepID=A0A2W7Q5K6_9RHOB|nr:LacI family DNA-binding transcriptional regulator [Palleronia aestuarii]PZX16999.1 LacI family transcriptional regulator [Palleronia aestuarii]